MNCVFKINIQTCIGISSLDPLGVYTIDLPFIPTAGMSIHNGDWSSEQIDEETGISYDAATKELTIFTMDAGYLHAFRSSNPASIEVRRKFLVERVKQYQESGWVFEEDVFEGIERAIR